MTFLSKRRAFRVDNLLNKIAGAGADIVINATDVFAQQSHTDELRADEGKQNGKEHKYAFRRPLRSQCRAKYNKQYRQAKPADGDNTAQQTQQAQRRRRQAGHGHTSG